jgi:hypothetical protein
MTSTRTTDELPADSGPGPLIAEAERYLETVELFRALGCEPTWRYDEGYGGLAVELIAPYLERVSPV